MGKLTKTILLLMGITRHQVLDIDTDKLQHYENNAKLHPKEQVDQLIESIASFGFLDPIAYDENFIIIEGHGRHLAAKQMGLKLVPAFLIAGMTEPEKIAYRIFHNKSTMNSDLDLELLKGDIELLVDADFDLDLTGFGAEDISLWAEDFEDWAEKEEVQREAIEQIKATRNNGFVAELDREEPKEEDDIEVEKLLEDVGKVESRVKLGEIWQLGRHKIACGDSTIESNVRALLGDRFDEVGMVWADPPFNTKIQQGRTASGWGVIEGDNLSDSEFNDFVKRLFSVTALFDTPLYICCHWKSYPVFFNNNSNIKALIIWVKNNFGLGNGYRPQHEFICFYGQFDSTTESNVWEISKDSSSEYKHPMQKPLALLERAFNNSSLPNDLIFDPFLGSAPSIIAAQNMDGDRVVYGFELSPDYCEVIIKRFEQFTGDTAKLIGSL